MPWGGTIGPCRALDLRFGVRVCDPALSSYLEPILLPFADDGPVEDVVWFSVLERAGRRRPRLVVYAGGHQVRATARRSRSLDSLLWSLNRLVVATAERCLTLHASAVERHGVVVVLPATQNSGKTTLCAGLLRRGYRYVTDEAVAVDVATGETRPFPKALSLDPGSWPLFPDLEPELPDEQRMYVGQQWHLPAARFGSQEARPPVGAPRVLLSPSYRIDADSTVTPLRPAEAVVMLIENSFNASAWGQAGLDAAARLVRGCAVAGRLDVGDLEQACDIVDRAVEQALASRPSEEPRS